MRGGTLDSQVSDTYHLLEIALPKQDGAAGRKYGLSGFPLVEYAARRLAVSATSLLPAPSMEAMGELGAIGMLFKSGMTNGAASPISFASEMQMGCRPLSFQQLGYSRFGLQT